jgi:hypothetical protein
MDRIYFGYAKEIKPPCQGSLTGTRPIHVLLGALHLLGLAVAVKSPLQLSACTIDMAFFASFAVLPRGQITRSG